MDWSRVPNSARQAISDMHDRADLPLTPTPFPAVAEREARARATALRQLIAEAERACRFMEGLPDDTARYRARELRAEIAAVRDGL